MDDKGLINSTSSFPLSSEGNLDGTFGGLGLLDLEGCGGFFKVSTPSSSTSLLSQLETNTLERPIKKEIK